MKVKTIGDAGVYVAGMKKKQVSSPNNLAYNASCAFKCATDMLLQLQLRANSKTGEQQQQQQQHLLVRVGCASGTILGGIITRYKFAYDIFGSAVDSAEHMSSVGGPLSLTLSAQVITINQTEVDAFLESNPDFKSTPNSVVITNNSDSFTEVPVVTLSPIY